MLIIENNGNWERSRRTSTIMPDAHYSGGTVFVPVNVSSAKVLVADPDSIEGESQGFIEVDGYVFDEYRINDAVNLPQEAASALLAAFIEAMQALSILGVS